MKNLVINFLCFGAGYFFRFFLETKRQDREKEARDERIRRARQRALRQAGGRPK